MSQLTVLIPLDGSKSAELPIAFLNALAPLGDLKVRLVSVAESTGATTAEQERLRENAVAEYLDLLYESTKARFGWSAECIRRTGRPSSEVLDEAATRGVDLIVMTTHGRSSGTSDHLGSTADTIVRHAACPVLLIGPHASVPLQVRRITVPLDGSALASQALPVARAFAQRLGSSLRLVSVVDYPISVESDSIGSLAGDVVQSVELTGSLYLQQARRELAEHGVETAVLNGPASEALLRDLQEQTPDLVIMTSHGRTGLIRWALGSVTDRLVRGPVPVLVLKPDQAASSRFAALISPAPARK